MWAIHKRKVERPVTSAWLLWYGIGALLFDTSREAGADWDTTLFPIFMGVVNPMIITFLSLGYGQYKWTRLDTGCVIVCIVTIIVWKTTDSPLLGILGGVIADATAATPVIKKSWTDPKDEPVFPWAMFALGSAVNMFAVEKWVLKFWLFPVYMTVGSVIMTIPLVLYRLKHPAKKENAQ